MLDPLLCKTTAVVFFEGRFSDYFFAEHSLFGGIICLGLGAKLPHLGALHSSRCFSSLLCLPSCLCNFSAFSSVVCVLAIFVFFSVSCWYLCRQPSFFAIDMPMSFSAVCMMPFVTAIRGELGVLLSQIDTKYKREMVCACTLMIDLVMVDPESKLVKKLMLMLVWEHGNIVFDMP